MRDSGRKDVHRSVLLNRRGIIRSIVVSLEIEGETIVRAINHAALQHVDCTRLIEVLDRKPLDGMDKRIGTGIEPDATQ